MHIEPGVLNAAKVLGANAGALATLAASLPALVRRPGLILRTALAGVFFSVFMQAFHMPIGASELHFVGASAIYLLFGILPALSGFAIGLLLQGLLFEPQDLMHLGVNSLSLMLPLIAAHGLSGRHFFAAENPTAVRWASVVRFDAVYYAGVVAMVGFWLALGDVPTPLTQWATFAASYLPLVLVEPVFTHAVVRLVKRHAGEGRLSTFTVAGDLSVA